MLEVQKGIVSSMSSTNTEMLRPEISSQSVFAL
jgi:hypothetical protein